MRLHPEHDDQFASKSRTPKNLAKLMTLPSLFRTFLSGTLPAILIITLAVPTIGEENRRSCQLSDLEGGWLLIAQDPTPKGLSQLFSAGTFEKTNPFLFPYQYWEFDRTGYLEGLTSTSPIEDAEIEDLQKAPHKTRIDFFNGVIRFPKFSGYMLCFYILKAETIASLESRPGDMLLVSYSPQNPVTTTALFRRYHRRTGANN